MVYATLSNPVNPVEVTVPALIAALENHQNKGTKIVGIISQTQPRMNKTHRETGVANPFTAGVTRIAHRNMVLGANYGIAVNRERAAEGVEEVFEAQGLWVSKEYPEGAGEKAGMYTVRHKGTGKVYFAYKPYQIATDDPRIVTGTLVPVVEDLWRDNATGQFVKAEEVAPFLPPVYKAKKQGVEHDVAWRTLEVANVLQLRYAGITYVVQHREAA